jgi:hypothetical protein
MSYPTNPHLGLPFRLDGIAFAVTEQDTSAEVADCVELALRTVQGDRRTLSSFGRPDNLEFISNRDLAQAEIEQTIEDAEPRAQGVVDRDDSQADEGVLRLKAMWAWTQEGGGI